MCNHNEESGESHANHNLPNCFCHKNVDYCCWTSTWKTMCIYFFLWLVLLCPFTKSLFCLWGV